MAAIPEVLRAKTMGLPRWVWLAALGTGLTIGIILRYRASQASDEDVESMEEPYQSADAEGMFSPAFGIGGYGGGGYTGDPTVGSTYEDYLGSSMELADRMIELYRQGVDDTIGLITDWYSQVAPSVPSVTDPITSSPLPPEVSGGGGAPVSPPRATQSEQARKAKEEEEKQRKRMEEETIRARVDQAMSVRTDPRGRYRGKLAYQAAGRTRDRIETSARNHPNWGPYTLAWGRQLDGHSINY